MAIRPPLNKPGVTNFRRLNVLPLTPGTHTGNPDSLDLTYSTLFAGGGYTGPSSANTISALGTTLAYAVKLLGIVYVPQSNSAPTIAANAVGFVDFDGGTVAQFPLRPGDLITIGKTMNWAPKSGSAETFVYADALDALGLHCLGAHVVGAAAGTACRIQAAVMNTTGAPVAVPANWLPNINILRIEAF